ncbi:unnamed protein product [Rhizopus microsporus]
MAEELQAPERFGLCNDEKCSSFFRYLDVSVHTFVDGPDPRSPCQRKEFTYLDTDWNYFVVDRIYYTS